MVTGYCYLEKYDIHQIKKDMVYVLANLGYQGFLYGKCDLPCHAEEYIDDIIKSMDFLAKENKESFLYHPLILEELNPSEQNRYEKYVYSLLFLFRESAPKDIIERAFQHLDKYIKEKNNQYYFNNIRVLRKESYTKSFEAYIEPEYASYIRMLMAMLNGTYEETRLEEYKEALKTGKRIETYSEEKERLKRQIHDFFNCKEFARYAMLQKQYGILSEDAFFTDELVLLQRHNFCHYRNHPLEFDISVFDDNENEFSYKANIQTLKRIHNVSKTKKIIPYAATAFYESESGEEIISKIQCSFEINTEMLIPRFMVTEYVYSKNDFKFQRCLDIESMEGISSYDLHYVYKFFVVQMIAKMAHSAKECGLMMKKIKVFSYDYDLFFHVHSNNRVCLCQKPIRKNTWKTTKAEDFYDMYETVSFIGEAYFSRKKEMDEKNKIHEKEWKRAELNHQNEIESEKAAFAYNQRMREELEKEKKPEPIYAPFTNYADYEDYLISRKIERAYKICENYRKKHGID